MNENTMNNEILDEMDEEMSRRGFIKTAVVGVSLAYVGAIGYPIYRYLNSSVETSAALGAVKEVVLDKASGLAKGAALMFKFGTRPSLLIHHTDDTWVAMDAVCTHMGCTVKFDAESSSIVCACHGGKYDAKSGETISGPPPRPLTKYAVTLHEGSVTVTRA